jgi:hypothetical protein
VATDTPAMGFDPSSVVLGRMTGGVSTRLVLRQTTLMVLSSMIAFKADLDVDPDRPRLSVDVVFRNGITGNFRRLHL